MKRAREIAAAYRIVLEQAKGSGYVGSAVELPTVFARGETPDACVEATRKAIEAAVAWLLESGRRPPGAKRTVQVNIRLTPEESFQLKEAANRMNFRSVSDFIRSAAIRCGAGA
jgi:predicted RNase H-like HicB family nuclease